MKHIQRIERRADFQMLTGGSRLLAVLVSRLIFPAVKRIIPPKSKAESKITF